MASQLHYLTVQDILWINLQVTEKVHTYSFAKLEEATYYQYAYGESTHLLAQAARFAVGFPRKNPIESGNAATGFVALLAFLKLNGQLIFLKDGKAAEWYDSVQSKQSDAHEAIKSIARPGVDNHHATDIRTTVRDLISAYPTTLASLK